MQLLPVYESPAFNAPDFKSISFINCHGYISLHLQNQLNLQNDEFPIDYDLLLKSKSKNMKLRLKIYPLKAFEEAAFHWHVVKNEFLKEKKKLESESFILISIYLHQALQSYFGSEFKMKDLNKIEGEAESLEELSIKLSCLNEYQKSLLPPPRLLQHQLQNTFVQENNSIWIRLMDGKLVQLETDQNGIFQQSTRLIYDLKEPQGILEYNEQSFGQAGKQFSFLLQNRNRFTRCIFIEGPSGVGKTTMTLYYLRKGKKKFLHLTVNKLYDYQKQIDRPFDFIMEQLIDFYCQMHSNFYLVLDPLEIFIESCYSTKEEDEEIKKKDLKMVSVFEKMLKKYPNLNIIAISTFKRPQILDEIFLIDLEMKLPTLLQREFLFDHFFTNSDPSLKGFLLLHSHGCLPVDFQTLVPIWKQQCNYTKEEFIEIWKSNVLEMKRNKQSFRMASELVRVPSKKLLKEGQDSEGNLKSRFIDSKNTSTELFGLENEKQTLTKWVQQKLAGKPNCPTGFLLTGKPGTGKTKICQYLASHFDFPLFSLTLGGYLKSERGESEQNIVKVFQMAKLNAPCFLLLDEFDAFFSNKDDYIFDDLLNVFMNELDQLRHESELDLNNMPVFILATTNLLDKIPEEFRKRKDRFQVLDFKRPDLETRTEILNSLFKDRVKREWIKKLATMTKDWNAAQLKQLYQESALLLLQKLSLNQAIDFNTLQWKDLESIYNFISILR